MVKRSPEPPQAHHIAIQDGTHTLFLHLPTLDVIGQIQASETDFPTKDRNHLRRPPSEPNGLHGASSTPNVSKLGRKPDFLPQRMLIHATQELAVALKMRQTNKQNRAIEELKVWGIAKSTFYRVREKRKEEEQGDAAGLAPPKKHSP